jgi:tryptophan synthase alpha chain
VGFGISTPEQAQTVAQHADAVVIGSAIVSEVAKFGRDKDFVQRVIETVKPLVEAIRSVSV